MSTPTPTQLYQSLLQYLTQVQQGGAATAAQYGIKDLEPLEIAIQLLGEATGVTHQPEDKVVDGGLLELFRLGVSSVRSIESQPKFAQFLAQLKGGDFFKGVQPNTLEYNQRMEQARSKFQAKFAESSAASSPVAADASMTISDADKAAAEAAKNEGNALLGKADHAGAVAKYSEAIRLNPQHAIYFANRAAAYVNLKDYAKAIADCQSSIDIDPAYPKSRYRLGQSYAAQGEYAQAIEAFEAALQRTGKDEGMAVTIREQIKIAQNKLNPPVQAPAGDANPFAGLGGLGGMDFGALLNNPMISGLMNSPEIAGMMQNPEIMNMMKNMDFGSLMKDPSLAGLTGAGGLSGAAARAAPQVEEVNTQYVPPAASDLFDDAPAAAAPAAAAPAASKPASSAGGLPSQLSAFLSTPAGQAAASDPDLQPVLADIQANGISAAMKYMSNPKVMSKIQAIMGPLMGGR